MPNIEMAGFSLRSLFFVTIVLIVAAGCSRATREDPGLSFASLSWLERTHGFITDPEADALLKRVMGRLVRAANAIRPESRAVVWRPMLLNYREPLAFSVGSGYVIVTTGLIQRLQNEAQLAAVLGHEMGHQLLGHTQEALLEAGQGSAPQVVLSPEMEQAADSVGLLFLKYAGYDLREAPAALVLLHSAGGDYERVSRMKAQVQTLKPFLPSIVSSREFNRVKKHLGEQA